MDYIVIKESSLNYLVQEVNKAIANGYQPVGGVCFGFSSQNGHIDYVQALIRQK